MLAMLPDANGSAYKEVPVRKMKVNRNATMILLRVHVCQDDAGARPSWMYTIMRHAKCC